jgi:hypothetical protein
MPGGSEVKAMVKQPDRVSGVHHIDITLVGIVAKGEE